MHTFDNFPQDRRCPICGTADDRPGVLVVDADEAVGGIVRHAAHPVHLDCLVENAWFSPRRGIIVVITKKQRDQE